MQFCNKRFHSTSKQSSYKFIVVNSLLLISCLVAWHTKDRCANFLIYIFKQIMHKHTQISFKAENTNWRERLSTVELLIREAWFVTKVNNIFSIKWADLNWLVQGGQLYWAFPFRKSSLVTLSYILFSSVHVNV